MKKDNFKLEDLIWVKSNSLSTELCDLIIEKFNNDDRIHPGEIGIGLVESVKKTMDLNISHTPGWKNEDNKLFEIIIKEIEEYSKYVRSVNSHLGYVFNGNVIISDTGYNVQRYENGTDFPGFYDWHNDASFDANGIRVLTFMWYLNDVEIGGETEFMNDLKIKPEKGKLVIFPASWQFVHRGLVPVSNKKWICTGWTYAKLNDQ
jgi:hypothetical protein